jgi:hypothetical protein
MKMQNLIYVYHQIISVLLQSLRLEPKESDRQYLQGRQLCLKLGNHRGRNFE